jgi:hypothetical protein
MRQPVLWSSIILATIVIDLGVRFGMPFDLIRVTRVEAFLFLATSVLLFVLYKHTPWTAGKNRTFQVVLVASYALAGIRAAIWAAGQPVFHANIAILSLAVVAVVVVKIRRRTR